MARRNIDNLNFAAEGVVGRVYYDDGAGAGRSIAVVWEKNGQPTAAPSSQYQPFTGQRAYPPGQQMSAPFCEDKDAVTLTSSANYPFATIAVEKNASACAAPAVVCDLTLQVVGVSGVTLTIAVTTSHGPWQSSVDGVNFGNNQTDFPLQYGQRGTVTVRDAARCVRQVDFVIPDPGNPKPAGELLDFFYYAGFGVPDSRVEVYGLRTAPYTVAAWSPSHTPLPGTLSEAQRGHPDGFELPARCVDTTRLRLFSLLAPPFARLEATANSPLCGYFPPDTSQEFRFTYVTGTNETVKGADGTIQAAVAGNAAPVLFSLDGFTTAGQASGTFTGLRAGVYVVWAREQGPPARTITRQITLAEPPHGVRYRLDWLDLRDVPCRAELLLRGYAGPVETLRGAADVCRLDWASASAAAHFFDQLVLGSEATLSIVAQAGDRLGDLACEDERQLRLDLTRAGALAWTGWVLPDLYEEPLLARPYVLTVRATDALGTVQQVPFTDAAGQPLTGLQTHWQLLRGLLDRLNLPLPWAVLHQLYPVGVAATAADEPLQLVSTDAAGFADDKGKPWTCGQVLLALLNYHQMRVQQREGSWYFERLPELNAGPLAHRRYDAAGQPAAPTPTYSLLRVVYPPYPDPRRLHWQEGRQLLGRHPAVAAVTITQEPSGVRNYFPPPAFPAADFDPATGRLLAGWTGTLQVRRVADANDISKPASLRLLAGAGAVLDSPPIHLPAAGQALYQGAIGLPDAYRPFRCGLSFDAQPDADSGFQADAGALEADFVLGVGYQNGAAITWLLPDEYQVANRNPASGFALDGFPVYAVNGTGKASVRFSFSLASPFQAYENLVIRLHGSSKGEITLSNFALTIGTEKNGSFVNESRGQTGAAARLTRQDNKLVWQLADTLNVDERVFAVLQRSVLLTGPGTLLSQWRAGADPAGVPAYGVDLATAARLGWQRRPCAVLRGLLAGDCSPGAVLVDPVLEADTGLLITAARWALHDNTWEVTAVENLTLAVPRPARAFGLLSQTGRPLLSQAGTHLLPQNAS